VFIANQLKLTNRAELLLYLWQIEDILRAYNCDIDRLKEGYLTRFELNEAQKEELINWYANLCTMMLEEGVKEQGHLQICKNVLIGLDDLHDQIVAVIDHKGCYAIRLKVSHNVRQLQRLISRAAEDKGYHQQNGADQAQIQRDCFDMVLHLFLPWG
jgi:hypothetical protein